jgi:UDP-galactose transporter B1
MYYGTVQELVFHIDKDEGTPGSITLFLLATNTFSSFLLAWIWTFIGPILLSQKKAKTDYNSNTTNSSKNSNQADINSSSSSSSSLNHPLIILTSITYLLAMAASNESLHYVSYPTCVLAKSSKLIPTMIVGWVVDRYRRRGRFSSPDESNSKSNSNNDDSHTTNNNNSNSSSSNNNSNSSNISNHSKGSSINVMEWMGAILITVGILSFQYIQLQKQQHTTTTTTNTTTNDHHGNVAVKDEGDSPYGLALLGLSLCMDGIMAACQNSLKHGVSSSSSSSSKKKSSELVVSSSLSYHRQKRPPSAMETMLYINLYATFILLPLSYYAGQFQRGIHAMISTSSSSCSSSTTTGNNNSNKSSLLLQLNLSASLGQVFIFLTIHHFSPVICTTITTTRKFFTILLSVYKFGHVLSIWQWISVTLVFIGLYMEIVAKLFERVDDGHDSASLMTTKKRKKD